MGQRLIISESERNQIRGLYAKPIIKEDIEAEIQSDIENMIEGGVIGKDIVPLPPNDIFDPNVFGSYHYYKKIHYTFLQTGMLGGKYIMPIAYYKVTDPEIVNAIKNYRTPKLNKSVLSGHWHFTKDSSRIELLISSLATGAFKDNGVIGSMVPPKGIINRKQLQWGNSWFAEDSGDIFLGFSIASEQAEPYMKLMEEVVKIKDIPDPDKK